MARRVAVTVPATTSIVNYYSSGGVKTTVGVAPPRRSVTSGALTAGEFYTALNIAGSGWVPLLYVYNNSATPTHTIRLQVTVDGTIVFDATSDTITTSASRFAVIAAGCAETGFTWDGEPIRFNSSLVVKIASSQAGTDYVGLAYEYQLT